MEEELTKSFNDYCEYLQELINIDIHLEQLVSYTKDENIDIIFKKDWLTELLKKAKNYANAFQDILDSEKDNKKLHKSIQPIINKIRECIKILKPYKYYRDIE